MAVFKMQVLWYDWEPKVSVRGLQEMKMGRRVRTDSALKQWGTIEGFSA